MPSRILPLLLALSGIVAAGGMESIHRSQPLHWVPGVIEVFSVPLDRPLKWNFTDSLILRVNGQRLQVFVSTSTRGDTPGSSMIDDLTAWVPTPGASIAQKQALIQVVQTYLRGCALRTTPQQLAALRTLKDADWTQGGWHEKTVGDVKIGWADGNGFGFADGSKGGKSRTALSVKWPSKASRCQF